MSDPITVFQRWHHLRVTLECVTLEVDICEDHGKAPALTVRVMPDSFDLVSDASVDDIATLGVALCDLASMVREGRHYEGKRRNA